ncbi:hypothetical protein [Kitasatospora sp. NPDC057223]|uniref:hypothetical protein n=1 Tax=Kitasatospora sp. NPDC057223 TaxID=3346055 RepID=UPI003624FF0B
MSICSEHPVSAEQLFAALVALGAEPVLDPELWPEGPQEGVRRQLLGALLATVELEITVATRLGDDQELDIAEAVLGWSGQVGDPALAFNVLVNRLQRTATQFMDLDEEIPPPGLTASSMAMVTAADTLDAHLRFEADDDQGVRQALGRAETSVTEILENMHDLRVAIGDAEEME